MDRLILMNISSYTYSAPTPSLLCFFGQRIRDPVLHALKATRTYLGTALARVALAFVQCPVFTLCSLYELVVRLLVLSSIPTPGRLGSPNDHS